ncbi:hypothetical protein C6P45_002633 [Maudiozyma exigua]|uniref:Uncharacterized protein n=1 Tax=Maudiozyma exigua TaxID=34358 RepID=A0A9P7B2Y9_MAUEX|nr:hypothetical protein C6P45_002633 [Kazachstania exigua]
MANYYEDKLDPFGKKMTIESDTFGEPLSDSVGTLLQDDMFSQDNSEFINENGTSGEYQVCMSLFITGQTKKCLETMFENDLLSEEILSHDKSVYDLYLSACNELTDLQELGVTLKQIIRTTFTGDTKNDIGMNHYKTVSIYEKIEFWDKYFRNSIRTIKIRSDKSSAYVLEVTLKEVIAQSSKHISSMVIANMEPSIITYLQELVRMYIFDIEIGIIGNKKSRKLYDSLCSSVPSLSDILSTNNTVSGQSYEDRLLSQLNNELGSNRIKKHLGKVETAVEPNTTVIPDIQKDRPVSPEKQDGYKNATDSILSYIKQNKFTRKILLNKHIQAIVDRITKMDSSTSGITIAVTILMIARYNRRRISYILRNFGSILKHILPYLLEFIRILTST